MNINYLLVVTSEPKSVFMEIFLNTSNQKEYKLSNKKIILLEIKKFYRKKQNIITIKVILMKF